ncbi:MAG: hypothetical protein Q4E73_00595 [Lachnospiraceae bacterium]|nr:hypothetical protein [Lachnospiraceae bacterium]
MSRYRKIGLAVMIIGVAAGSLFANMTYKANYYFLADLNMDLAVIKNMDHIYIAHYAVYILGKRLFQLFVLVIIFRFFVVEAIIAISGFTASFVFSVFITYQLLQTGFSGVGIILTAMFPQWIFYGAAIYWWIQCEEKKGKREAFRFYLTFSCLFVLGILTEIFVNPRLLLL